MASVAGLWTSPAKGSGRMDARESARALEGHGLEGCAHARPGTKRQVLFASAEHLDALGVDYGRIRENFTIEGAGRNRKPLRKHRPRHHAGVKLAVLAASVDSIRQIGQQLRVGDALFEITMVCDPCSRMDEIRPGLQAELDGRRGMLARVVESGEVTTGDEVHVL